ncbi:MAG: phytoene/squalene synthase family protein [Acidobacteria bacterium]|nr:phytoene/squalene synthase family protein [Acidobacteriota bacterium]
MLSLEDSYRHCRQVARRRAKNFYYSFLLLPRQQRDAMCAIYAFMRYCDDLSDEPGAAREPLLEWRRALDRALEGECAGHPTLPAFHDTVRRYAIPGRYFHDLIDGVTSDLEPRRIRTFEELYRYCYQVASVVGLSIVHIFGFSSPEALQLAEKCGVAFQLTNILRDVREDAERGRVYLPAEDLERFGVDPGALRRTPQFLELMRFETARARQYYRESAPLIGMVVRRSRSSLWALIAIYSRLLDKIERSDFDVLSGRISLSMAEKLWILVQAAARSL